MSLFRTLHILLSRAFPGEKTLVPLSDIRETQHGYRSLSEDPQFLVQTVPSYGWYQLQISLTLPVPTDEIKFYPWYAEGIQEDEATAFLLNSDEPVERLLYFPRKPKGLRFDPTTQKGNFSITHFTLIPAEEPRKTLLTHLGAYHPVLGGQSPGDLADQINIRSRRAGQSWDEMAYHLYNQCFAKHEGISYQQWISHYETELVFDPNRLTLTPKVSVLVPVYNTEPALLRETINSVQQQSYHNWELCLVDDASPDERVREVLAEAQASDERIQVHLRSGNGHISACSNDALALANGEFCALLDHDDLLAEDALAYMVQAINVQPEALVLYSDEDKLDASGLRFEPHFKPDFNPDLLYSQNYMSHLTVYNTELMRSLGGFRIGLEGSQDHDMLLRATAAITPAEVVHVPRVLYHWRAIEGSTALQAGEKRYTEEASIRSLSELLGVRGVRVNRGEVPNTYRLTWPLPEPQPMVSILIPTRDQLSLLKQCVNSVLEQTDYAHYEILILDNQSKEPETLAYFEDCCDEPRIRVLAFDQPFNFSAINNMGARYATGEILVLLNNDIEVINTGWLQEMVSQAIRPEIGCVGAKLYYPDDTIQHAGVITGMGGIASHSHKHLPRRSPGYFSRLVVVQNYACVTAAALAVRRTVFDAVDGLDETLAVAFNDVDFCLRVQAAGYRNLWTPYAEMYHYESVSRGQDKEGEKLARFTQEHSVMESRWGHLLHQDPSYNPNLTLLSEQFGLATIQESSKGDRELSENAGLNQGSTPSN